MTKKFINEIQKRVKQWYIREQKHPERDLWIYCYTEPCVYDNVRDEYTRMCRGLVLDKEGNIVARPFSKFFNYEELKEKPVPPYIMQEKLDWSLGILFNYKWERIMATKWSFDSKQAKKWMEIFQKKYRFDILSPEITYLFEIIYPSNRIVVNYGEEERLVLLGMMHTQEWHEVYWWHGLDDRPKEYGQRNNEEDLLSMQAKNIDNEEGYVCIAKDWTRFKMKFKEYLKLHRIMTTCSSIMIRESMKNWDDLSKLLKDVPDEFYKQVDNNIQYFNKKHKEVKKECKEAYEKVKDMEDRRQQAEWLFSNCKYPGIIFMMLDGKHYDNLIRKAIRPEWHGQLYTYNI